jgi:hypothetical protein
LVTYFGPDGVRAMFFLHFFGHGQYIFQYPLPRKTRQPCRSASARMAFSSLSKPGDDTDTASHGMHPMVLYASRTRRDMTNSTAEQHRIQRPVCDLASLCAPQRFGGFIEAFSIRG